MSDEHETWSPRYYRPEDDEQLLQVLQAAFDGWPKVEIAVPPLDHLRWKLSSSEGALRSHIVAAGQGSVIAGRISLHRTFKTKGRLLQGHLGFDAAVHPDYWGRGVMGGLRAFRREQFEREIDLQLGISENPAMVRVRQQDGVWPLGNRIEVLVHDRRDTQETASVADAWSIAEPESFDKRVNALWPDASGQFDLILERNDTFLNWRYCDRRAGSFSVLQAEQDGRILGYAVLSTSYGNGCIADLLALPARLDVVRALLREALARFRAKGIGNVECWCAAFHPYREVLAGLGFTEKKRAPDRLLPAQNSRGRACLPPRPARRRAPDRRRHRPCLVVRAGGARPRLTPCRGLF